MLASSMPYSGPLSALGGINGRKVTLISLDDGYSPPKTVEQTRKLVVDAPGDELPNFNNFQPSMMLPGITVTTSPTNYDTFHSARLGRFDGKSWVLIGDLISG